MALTPKIEDVEMIEICLDEPIAPQPEGPVAPQPEEAVPVARQPEEPVARQPEEPVARQPEEPVARQPEELVAPQQPNVIENQAQDQAQDGDDDDVIFVKFVECDMPPFPEGHNLTPKHIDFDKMVAEMENPPTLLGDHIKQVYRFMFAEVQKHEAEWRERQLANAREKANGKK